MFRTISSLFLVATLFACAQVKSCGKTSDVSSDVFIWNNYTEPTDLDPARVEDKPSFNIILQLFEGLTEYHPETLEPVPGVATHWEASPDGLTYTFHLRNNAKWSNGDPVTAHDFEYSWKRALNPETASPYASILYFIKGAQDYNTGKTTDTATVDVVAETATQLVVTLNYPTPFLPQLVSHFTFRPVHRATVEQWKDQWTRPEHIVSNGAYMLQTWVPQKEVVVVKNPNYWDHDNVRIPTVKFLHIEDRETALKLHLQGGAHYTIDIPLLKVPSLEGRPDFQKTPMFLTYCYQFNTKQKPFDDPKVRRALSSAIDRQKIVDFMKKGDYPTTHFVQPGIKGYNSPADSKFNPAVAKQLLADAGFSDLNTFPPVTLRYNTSENHRMIAELVQNMWKTNLGINVTLQNEEWKVLVQSYQTGDFQIGRAMWGADYIDPYAFLSLFESGSQQNYTGWSDPAYDALISQQSETIDPAGRNTKLAEAEALLMEASPIIPIFHPNQPALIDPKVKGFYHNPQIFHPMRFAYFGK